MIEAHATIERFAEHKRAAMVAWSVQDIPAAISHTRRASAAVDELAGTEWENDARAALAEIRPAPAEERIRRLLIGL